MAEFHFVRPLALLLMLVLALLVFLIRGSRTQRGIWTQIIEPHLQPYVLSRGDDQSQGAKHWLWVLLAALLILALAGPAWEKLPQPVYSQKRPLVIALDLSQSMNAQDVLPSRLDRAKITLQDILAQRLDGQTALIVFAGDAFTVTPLTDDTRTIVSLLASLRSSVIPVQGSRIGPALAMSSQLLRQAATEQGEILLLTDGLTDSTAAESAARELAREGHRVSVIAFGTEQGGVVKDSRGDFIRDRRGNMIMAKLPSALLQAVAAAGNGSFVTSVTTEQQIVDLFRQDTADFSSAVSERDLATDLWREQGPWLILLCLPIAALAFRRGVLIVLLVMVCFPWQFTYASGWSSLWSRPDQQGDKLFQAEKFAEAAEAYSRAEHKAAALFRDGEYAQSAATLEGIETVDAHYNRANAQAFAGNLDAAINAYESALQLDPTHEDAKFNLDLLRQMQQQQEQQQQSQDDSEQEQQEQDQQSDQQEQGDDSENSEQQDGEQQEGEEQQQSEQDEEQESQEQQSEQSDQQGQEQQQKEQQQAQQAEQMTEEEQQQAVEQWLRRIPDDPGGLLRRKFKRQYQERPDQSDRSGEQW